MRFSLITLFAAMVSASLVLGINILTGGWPFPWNMRNDFWTSYEFYPSEPYNKFWDVGVALGFAFIVARSTELLVRMRRVKQRK